MRDRGLAGGVTGIKLGASPSFGGGQVVTYLTPNRYPTETAAVETTDRVMVRGRMGEIEFAHHLRWETVTWSVTHNTLDGFAMFEMHQAEKGRWKEVAGHQNGDYSFTVEPGPTVEIAGTLSGPEGESETRRHYEWVRDKGVVHVEQQFEDRSYNYDIERVQ